MSSMQTQPCCMPKRQIVPDGILIQQALAGDQRAFEALVRRYNSLLARYIYGLLKDSEHVYDVLQHVFLKLYLSLPTLLPNVSIKGWLFQVARHRCLDELRKRYRRAEIPFSALECNDQEEDLSPIESIADPEPTPDAVAERSELRGVLQQAIESLPPKLRPIVYLRCFRQLSFSEIGHLLKMPEPTVKTYYFRSLPRLRTELTNHVFFLPLS